METLVRSVFQKRDNCLPAQTAVYFAQIKMVKTGSLQIMVCQKVVSIEPIQILHRFFVDPTGNIFAAVQGYGVFRSDDNGDNWTLVQNTIPGYTAKVFCITTQNTILEGTYGSGIFCSTDGGNTWAAKKFRSSPIRTNRAELNITNVALTV